MDTSAAEASYLVRCKACDGTGMFRVWTQTTYGGAWKAIDKCVFCKGSGYVSVPTIFYSDNTEKEATR